IPLEELLGYMEEAAAGIDFLNEPRHNLGGGLHIAIQHCDIKPQNILLVAGGVQISDAGMARIFGEADSAVGDVAYLAPEIFTENRPSATTDQYMLAISYIELLTGELPFDVNGPGNLFESKVKGLLQLAKL